MGGLKQPSWGPGNPYITVCASGTTVPAQAAPAWHSSSGLTPVVGEWPSPGTLKVLCKTPSMSRQPSHRWGCCHLQHVDDKKCPATSLLFQLANDKLCHSGDILVVLCIILLLRDHFYSTEYRTECQPCPTPSPLSKGKLLWVPCKQGQTNIEGKGGRNQ